MIRLQKASLQRGTKVLLEQADLILYPGQKLGVIGPNGSGKTSLFRLLLGELSVDAGECFVPKEWQIAHMAQEVSEVECTALDYVLTGDAEYVAVQRALEAPDVDGETLAHLFEQFEAIGGYTAPTRAHQLLNGLGFAVGDDAKSVGDFSGGWRIRLNLAKALMCRSDLLLLDEPTNHLDLDACLWLERWLQSYSGTLVMISHDRDFLDSVIDHVTSFEGAKLQNYTGNYSDYERQKAERLAQQEANFQRQQARIEEIENFVRRFRAKATKAKQAQSRLKELERMETIAPAHVDSPFNFRFYTPERCPQQMLTFNQCDVGYGDKSLFNDLNMSILGDTRVALLGSNGAGKSTLIKAIAGATPLLGGDRIEGAHLNIGYFAQHQLEALDLDASCFLHIQRLSPQATEQSIRNFLGGFDFAGDRVFESIHHFSGGEKARLALAILVWQKPNLLLLDEPTNHLDIEVRHALTVALQGFEGAVLLISHDRHLIKNTVDQFWLVEHGQLTPFEGDLNDYYEYQLNARRKEEKSEKSAVRHKRNSQQNAAQLREQLKPLRNKLKSCEADIERLTQSLATLEDTLARPDVYEGDKEKLNDLLKDQAAQQKRLQRVEEEWLEAQEAIEALNPD